MRRRIQLGVTAAVVVAITSLLSHSLVDWLGIRTGVVKHRVVGEGQPGPTAYMAGSSLLFDCLALERVSKQFQQGMETWFVAGSSPSEWEPFQTQAGTARLTLIGISAYDLNEEFLCDFRSQVVSLPQAARDLAAIQASWPLTKRVISQYPLKYVRFLFPTAGRSAGVMGGLKEQMGRALKPWMEVESEAGPKMPALNAGDVPPEELEKISDWSTGTMLRWVTKMRSACHGRHSYDGLKKLAFLRILEKAEEQGRVIVVVLPVSPAYSREFLAGQVPQAFERALADAEKSAPKVQWVRLDQVPGLNSNDNFWDLVHMNTYGRRAATDAFLTKCSTLETEPLQARSSQP